MRTLRRYWREHRGIIITATVFACVLLIAVAALSTVRHEAGREQLEALRLQVVRAAAACYAAEGFYPAELGYLADHYGLKWDDSRFIVRYDCFAANILPDVRVLARGDETL